MKRTSNTRYLEGVGRRPRRSALAALKFAGLAALALLLVALLADFLTPEDATRPLPDFAAIESVAERKAAFFAYLLPFASEANAAILRERARAEALLARLDRRGRLKGRSLRMFRRLARAYGFEEAAEKEPSRQALVDLLSRIDVIPPSLALAQAALESGWGSSRFAREGNNLFGIWCYEPGCGLVPRRRPPGATHEVKRYESPLDCFQDYIRNLNTNDAYVSMRILRRELRSRGRPLTGLDLAPGLERYSQEGWAYVDKVQSLIHANDLARYDAPSGA